MRDKRILSIVLIIFTNILGAGVILPVLPLYAEGTFGASILQATLLATAFFAAQALAAPVLGKLSDRIGRRPVLIGSQIGTVVAFILFFFAGEIGAGIDALQLPLGMSGGLIMLYVARIIDGLTGGNITTAQAYIADITDPDERAQNLGLLQAAFGIGFVFGPALGGILGNFGPRMPFLGGIIITALTLLLTFVTLEESLTEEIRRSQPQEGDVQVQTRVLLANRPFAVLLAVTFIGTLAFAGTTTTYSLYADAVLFPNAASDSEVIRNVGLMLAFVGIVSALTQVFALRPMVRRFGERTLVAMGLLIFSIGVFLTGFVRSPIIATMLLAPYSFGRGISEPGQQALTTRFGNERVQGQLLGLNQSARSMGLILGPVWGGLVFQFVSPLSVWFVAGIVALVSAGLAWWLKQIPIEHKTVLRKVRPEAPQSAGPGR